ncbi:recombinase family protein [Bacillus sp. DX1.1]|uniref:recombinase family protein n=1 Tax=unclassified Bacillus (in: firmicutes) TaxID=185979 RepID=UPI002571025B|nr:MULTISPECIES: recombinase family protein [unclassified Bacillus (in: firmicutes)]MDM5155671.1 recombinase family protein [Bacillus sp. DX1.1]WJE79975.1 recombinase family protein [Bacillus sp. DX3.1]
MMEIAFSLNREKILTNKNAFWSEISIQRLLTNETYLGKIIYGKTKGSGHKNKNTSPLFHKEKNNWIIVENAHIPLISQENYTMWNYFTVPII